jgi:phospholipid/cholesterol/gamma-HCH transport system substrate-binding protein
VNKEAPSPGRIAAMAAFALTCFGLLLFLWLAFGGPVPLKPKGYRFETSFAEAGQLALQADVRISGVPVGTVKGIEPDPQTGRSDVTVELQPRYAPLPSDTRAILRQKTLLGETYVELTPGSADAPPVPEDGRLAASQVSDTVELDEILRAFDPETRQAFQAWMQGQAQAVGDHGEALNDALGELTPFAERTGDLADTLDRQSGALSRLVANTGVVLGALTERDGQLRGLIRNADRVFAATGSRDRELREAIRALPTFAVESRRTLTRVSRFARQTDPLVRRLRPAARQLSPALRGVQAVAPDLERFFTGLGPLVSASRSGFPAASQVLDDARPLLAQLDPFTRQLTPMLQFLGLYKRELTSFFGNAAAGTQAVEPSTGLHYLRTTNPLNPENLAVQPRRVGSNRTNAYAQPGALDRLARGLRSYETRHCGRAQETVTNVPAADQLPALSPAEAQALVPDDLLARIRQFAFGEGTAATTPAPPCVLQAPFATGAGATRYPHVRAR